MKKGANNIGPKMNEAKVKFFETAVIVWDNAAKYWRERGKELEAMYCRNNRDSYQEMLDNFSKNTKLSKS